MSPTQDDSTGVLDGQRARHRIWPISAWLLVLLLAGCRGAAAPPVATRVAAASTPTVAGQETRAATPAPTASPTPLLRRLPATEPPATLPPTATASPILTVTATVTVSPPLSSATPPLPSPTPAVRPVAVAGVGEIRELWAALGGAVWLLGGNGLYEIVGGAAAPLSDRPPMAVLGADRLGRAWCLFDQGRTVGAYQAGSWTYYGADEGWEPAPDAAFARADKVVVDGDGRVWLALGREGLRLLDPTTGIWATVQATSLGFAPAPAGEAGPFGYDPRLAFTAVARDRFDNIWVAACAVRVAADGPAPLLLGAGQGARWFDGEQWAGPADSGGRCILDIEVDGAGKVWLAGRENDLWQGNVFVRYEPDPGRWLQLPVPESESAFGENPRFVADFWFDGDGTPWMRVERRGGATFPPDAVYYQEGGEWRPFLPLLPGTLAFNPGGARWLFLETGAGQLDAGLYRHDGAGFALVLPGADLVDPGTLVVDGAGRAWFASRDGSTLWVYAGP